MLISKKLIQKIFKYISYSLFKIRYGNVRGIIESQNKEIEIKTVKKNSQINYNVYKILSGRLYTDRVNDLAIIKNNNIIKGPSFQFRYKNLDLLNAEVDKNIVFTKGTPRIKKKLNGKVLSLLTGGAGNGNYWHWLFDVLPRFNIFAEIKNFDDINFFLLPDNKKKFQIETLKILRIPEEKQLSSVNFRHISADELYVTDHPYVISKNATKDIQNIPGWISEWLKSQFLNNKVNNSLKTSKKIYIDRSDSDSNVKKLRSITNENEVKKFLVDKGFDVLKLTNYHFQDQAFLFNNAEVIVGLHGAGFANTVFCRPKTKIIELKNKTAGKMIENLALKNNLVHKTLSLKNLGLEQSNQYGHINVPLNLLNDVLES